MKEPPQNTEDHAESYGFDLYRSNELHRYVVSIQRLSKTLKTNTRQTSRLNTIKEKNTNKAQGALKIASKTQKPPLQNHENTVCEQFHTQGLPAAPLGRAELRLPMLQGESCSSQPLCMLILVLFSSKKLQYSNLQCRSEIVKIQLHS